ncbi:MAG: hypothetical protein JXX28_09625 [Deltaproteobacteria bacterium]|nr:hypothetical protein [Deltaproteobacteria bacterium]
MRYLLPLLALSFFACRKEEPVDLDGDTVSPPEDCDDLNAAAHPGAEERCDGVDNDCDGNIDNDAVDALTFYADLDQDGYGDAGAPTAACEAPPGHVTNDADCDDTSALFHPGAAEADCADPADYNCDGSVGYADADGDGVPACEECDDSRADVNPGAPEVCDEADNNCNGLTDEEATDAPTWYLDADGDSYGSAALSVAACEAPAGYVADLTDCDDLEATVYPGAPERCDGLANTCGALPADEADADADGFMTCAGDCDDQAASARPGGTEVCDGVDNDCDGQTDESAVDAPTWYADGDGDGYGLTASSARACAAPAGYAALGGDCDDTAATAFPGGVEVCADALDNDCDGTVNEADATDAGLWHLDADGDSHGRADAGTRACLAPASYVASSDDCDDLRDTVYPGAAERCDGLANTCGALPADEADADGDGFMACEDDCDDADATTRPGAAEVCDGVDNNCNGYVDDNAVDQRRYYPDMDGDGYGVVYGGVLACEAPEGYAEASGDCDDSLAAVYPLAPQRCDGLANTCGSPLPSDEADADGDGQMACAGDCDDGNATIYTGAPQRCDGLANACGEPLPADEADADGDGQRGCAGDCDDSDAAIYTGAPQRCDGLANACGAPLPADEADADSDGFMICEEDCDDTDEDVNPDASEVPNDGIDNNCDGWNPPNLVYASAETSGDVWALNRDNGARVWTVSGLGAMRGVAYRPDGALYAALTNSGIVEIAPDGSSYSQVVAGFTQLRGLWWDDSTETLLFTTAGGIIGEYDPATGAVVELVAGLSGAPEQTVRFEGEDLLYTVFSGLSQVRVYDPADSTWSVFATLGFAGNGLLPTEDGGFWVSGGSTNLIALVDHRGTVRSTTSVGRNAMALAPDPLVLGQAFFPDLSAAVYGFTGSTTFSLATGLTRPAGVASNGVLDADGDGYTDRMRGGPDCDDTDPSFNPSAIDTYGDDVDDNCDFADGTDADGDGYSADATDPLCVDPDDANPSDIPEDCWDRGEVRHVNGSWLPVRYVTCGTGATSGCTANVAKASCAAIGAKVYSHASNGTSEVASLGATSSCGHATSYFTVERSMPAGACLVGISNLEWSSCCGTTNWHGNTLTFAAPGVIMGYAYSGASGYVSSYPNTYGTGWGCQAESSAAANLGGCTSHYVACTW